MNWQIKQLDWRVYARNPLDTVVAQLKFEPILKISSSKGIADFQELVRERFPGYEEGETRAIKIGLDSQVSSKSEKVFHFIRKQDSCKVVLASDNIVIESKSHETRETLAKDLRTAIDALTAIYSPIKPLRLGVRYINLVNPDVLSLDLGKEVTFQSAIAPEYLSIPASVADLDGTTFVNQISSSIGNGSLTLRYGLIKDSENNKTVFAFDMDRYIEGELDLEKIDQTLTEFTNDIFSLFFTLPGPDLSEWMSSTS